jgi:hypothetical protein
MSAFRPDPARGRVLFRLHGFSPSWWFAPRAVLRVCCTPLPILGFVEFRAGRPAPFGSGRSCRPRRRFSPSKLFPCPQPSLFRGLLPSCRSPSGNPVGSTARPCSTGQVRRGSRCCHLLSLVASLGFSSTSCKKRVHLFRYLHRSLTAAVPWGLVLSHVPPGLGASCEVPGFRLRTLRSWTLAGKVVRLPLRVAEATGGERSSRFILVSIPLCSGCEHPLQVGKRKRGWPLPVAGDHDTSSSKSR